MLGDLTNFVSKIPLWRTSHTVWNSVRPEYVNLDPNVNGNFLLVRGECSLKNVWCSTQAFHRVFEDLYDSMLKPSNVSYDSDWKQFQNYHFIFIKVWIIVSWTDCLSVEWLPNSGDNRKIVISLCTTCLWCYIVSRNDDKSSIFVKNFEIFNRHVKML